ncbi:MAG: hypothetical protein M3460_16640 [Actinomycetota bacterium]|nr:hypothetical protein [Actinomycetota bacterium]
MRRHPQDHRRRRHLDRFRFFGNPVTAGYALGRTVYRYSAEPAEAARVAAPPPGLRLLEDNSPSRSDAPLHLPANVPDDAGRADVDLVWEAALTPKNLSPTVSQRSYR